MSQWEYRIVQVPVIPYVDGETGKTMQPIDVLNSLGQEGWELVSVIEYTAYFKRPMTKGGA